MTTQSQYQSIDMSKKKPIVDTVNGFNRAARELFFGWVLSISSEKSIAHEAGLILADQTKLLAHIPKDLKEDFSALLVQATKTIGVMKTRKRRKVTH